MIDTFLMIYIVIARIYELLLSKKNSENLIKLGAKELYSFHYKFIVAFHVFFIFFFLIKSINNADETLQHLYLYIFILIQFLRYKIILDLGEYWTTRIIVINKPLINSWIFKYLRHPNYIVVFFEIFLICLFFNDFVSLIFFSLINLILIIVRIYFEEKANKFRREKL
jgi:methyltransferase